MLKFMMVFVLLSLSLFAHAENCANSIAELKDLVKNAGVPLNWQEKAKEGDNNPLTLKLSNNGTNLKLLLTSPKGMWATVSGSICEVGDNKYVARVATMSWGPGSPKLLRMFKLSTISMDMPYPNSLTVTAKGRKFNFEPL